MNRSNETGLLLLTSVWHLFDKIRHTEEWLGSELGKSQEKRQCLWVGNSWSLLDFVDEKDGKPETPETAVSTAACS